MVKALKAQRRMYAGLAVAAVLSFAASSIPFRLAANDAAPSITGDRHRRDRARSRPSGRSPPAPTRRPNRTPPSPRSRRSTISRSTRAPTPKGSDDFQAALALITDGDEVERLCRGQGSRQRPRTPDHPVGRVSTTAAATCPTPTLETFKADAPMFVTDAVYRARLEAALVKADAPAADVIRLLGGADADHRQTRRSRLPPPIWPTARRSARHASPAPSGPRNSSMPRPSARCSTSSASLLTADDHWARAVHLMMHDRATRDRAAVRRS